jgi:hypothetical protein
MEIFRNIKNWAMHIYAWNFTFASSSSRRTSSSSMTRLPAAQHEAMWSVVYLVMEVILALSCLIYVWR